MRIVIDMDIDQTGKIMAQHVVHTEIAPWNKVSDPSAGGAIVDMVSYLAKLHAGTIPAAGTGWDAVTNHPAYAGKTRLQALRAEIVRLNDPQRALFGL